NVTFKHGSATAVTNFDEFVTSLPVIIRGNLTLMGSGANTVTVGTQYGHTGLVVGKNLTITTGGAADGLTFNKLQVVGKTLLTLGNGTNSVSIDDSVFTGAFGLTTGSGTDTVNLDRTIGTTAPTVFTGAALLSQGAGDDSVVRAGGTDANQL